MNNETIHQAINLCIQKNIPFVAYILPGNSAINFFSNPTNSIHSTTFYINFFGDKESTPIAISDELDALETIQSFQNCKPFPSPKISPWKESTNFESYCDQISQITSHLKIHKGKIVLSRVLCGEVTNINWANIALCYFKEHPKTFRYIYFTQETGCWLGASPEILISHTKAEPTFETMSLAGTRKSSLSEQSWDFKNIEEHNYVTDYIVSTLDSLGLKALVHEAENLNYGTIEHLCHRITSSINDIPYFKILNKLSPTPALAGYPLDNALNIITKLEEHPRICYGGYVALEDDKNFISYVNFRGGHFDSKRFCLYAGGGITADSISLNEWDETTSKINSLQQIIDNTI